MSWSFEVSVYLGSLQVQETVFDSVSNFSSYHSFLCVKFLVLISVLLSLFDGLLFVICPSPIQNNSSMYAKIFRSKQLRELECVLLTILLYHGLLVI